MARRMLYPNIGEEYRTVADGAGWTSRRAHGRLRFEGADAVSFLQALLTNDMASLVRGTGSYSAYLTPQGRMVADLVIYHRGDWLLAEVPDGMASALVERFDGLVFSEDVRVSDRTETIDEISCVGSRAAEAVARVASVDPATLDVLPELGQVDAGSGFVARGGDALLPEFRIFVAATETAAVVAALEANGAVRLSDALVHALRVEAGRPRFGVDMNEDTIPLEAGLLDRAISTSKGCYVGQEIVIRILHRGGGRVARRLVTLALSGDGASSVDPGVGLTSDGREIGRLTSIARSPRTDELIALGYVTRDLAEIGAELGIAEAGHATARVTGFAG